VTASHTNVSKAAGVRDSPPRRDTLLKVADVGKQRLAGNEAVFRAANERMADWEERDRAEALELYFCECADPKCNEKVRLRVSDYERVRSNPTHFFVVPGHEIPDVEVVVEPHSDWLLIEKSPPEAREIAEDTDLRQG
jgi:hypothetical protein